MNKNKLKVLVVSTSKKTRGGITAVLKLYEKSEMWRRYHCRWIGTHRDGNNFRKLWYYLSAIIQYISLAPFYEIIHFHLSLPMTAKRKYPLFRLAKLLRKKTVLHLHCGSQIDGIWNKKYQYMFEHCDCGILLSESLKKKIEEHIGQSDKLHVVYNPCPIVANNRNEKKNYILFSGTLYNGKGYKDLIRAFAIIANLYTDWKLVFAGNGEVDEAKLLANELGVSKQVELLGWISGEVKHRVFCESRVLCLPSYAEGFPMAVLDAWAYGLPVITTPVGGIPDIAEDGRNMLLFTPGDVKMLSEKLELLICNSDLREKIAKESEQLAKGMFSIESVTERLSTIYDGLIFQC